ncbi:MAG: sensor histidine kinase [Anaerolineae bacterium]
MTDALTIAENERRFIAQELHDHITQTMLQMNMQVGICQRYLEMTHYHEAKSELSMLEAQINTASRQLRQLVSDLRPPVDGEEAYHRVLQKQIEIHLERGGPPVNLRRADNIPLTGPRRLALTRIIQEALLNIRKHARAAQVTVSLRADPSQLQLTISDDGVGFDDTLIPNPLTDKGGAGIVNMQIRTDALNGTLTITSQPKQGTTVQVTIPL